MFKVGLAQLPGLFGFGSCPLSGDQYFGLFLGLIQVSKGCFPWIYRLVALVMAESWVQSKLISGCSSGGPDSGRGSTENNKKEAHFRGSEGSLKKPDFLP